MLEAMTEPHSVAASTAARLRRGIIDAVLIFTDKVRDPQGLPLRDGN